MSTVKAQKRPGRPEKQAVSNDPRQTLMHIATELFGKKGYDGVSLKEIGRAANVTPAMIAYYFKDKKGLLAAVLETALEKELALFQEIIEEAGEDRFAQTYIEKYLAFLNRNQWVPQLMMREIFSKDSELRTLIIEKFANKAMTLLPPHFTRDITSGKLRKDLDVRYTQLSLMGMCLFPCIVAPVAGPLLGYQLDDDFFKNYSAHVKKLFFDGAGGEAE